MRDAYLIGAGQSDYGSFPGESYRSLFRTAFENARDSVPDGIESEAVDEAVVGTLGVGGRQLGLPGPAVTEHVGLHGIPVTRVENACAASGYSVRQGVQAIRSGMADVVLASGVEIMTDVSGDAVRYWLGVSGETEWERLSGTTFAGVYAQMASRHMQEYGTTREQLSHVAVKNHENGAKNPHAQLGFECSLEDAMDAPTVADPLNLYHCCPTTDGAACVLLASEDVVENYTDDPIRVAGVGAGSDRVGLFQRDTYTAVPASQYAADRAYEMAGYGPDDLDFAEVHDCFAIAELMAYSDLGLCEPEEAGEFVASGKTGRDGEMPVNTSGGLKSKGHPIGATGAGQVVEVFKQLSGEAGERQLDDPQIGLTHNVGGSGGAAVVHVFEKGGAPSAPGSASGRSPRDTGGDAA
ncbi:thiolase domain-containing protein [Halorientalis regularis]|jgi:acetyl-CoA C-acetyltransferase|uniref:Acetyl-CoA C-acetyltransferase n=1 Tax=Halorientalis regularis TaxID=660518 RepID=A0A1G7MZD9_9EURY|nr:thiolase domain-containing protein [Halorientalis regularis]SDF66479.1 acetyl-CoA C-acetyltransferase [Halorientalis regularis]